MSSGGAPSGRTITIADGTVEQIVDPSGLGNDRAGFIVQNLTIAVAPAGRVILGGADVDDGTGIVLQPRSATSAQPNDFADEGSTGAWYARARGAAATLMVLILR